FNRLGADQGGGLLRELSVIGHPRIHRAEMRFDAELSPVVQFPLDERSRGLRLQTERMPAEINAVIAGFRSWKMKSVTEMSEGVATIHVDRKGLTVLKASIRHEGNSSGVSSARIRASALTQ